VIVEMKACHPTSTTDHKSQYDYAQCVISSSQLEAEHPGYQEPRARSLLISTRQNDRFMKRLRDEASVEKSKCISTPVVVVVSHPDSLRIMHPVDRYRAMKICVTGFMVLGNLGAINNCWENIR
jgi:hypothetical protein